MSRRVLLGGLTFFRPTDRSYVEYVTKDGEPLYYWFTPLGTDSSIRGQLEECHLAIKATLKDLEKMGDNKPILGQSVVHQRTRDVSWSTTMLRWPLVIWLLRKYYEYKSSESE